MGPFIAEKKEISQSSVVGAQSLPGYNESANVTNVNVSIPCRTQACFRCKYLKYSFVRIIYFLSYLEQNGTGRTVEIIVFWLTR